MSLGLADNSDWGKARGSLGEPQANAEKEETQLEGTWPALPRQPPPPHPGCPGWPVTSWGKYASSRARNNRLGVGGERAWLGRKGLPPAWPLTRPPPTSTCLTLYRPSHSRPEPTRPPPASSPWIPPRPHIPQVTELGAQLQPGQEGKVGTPQCSAGTFYAQGRTPRPPHGGTPGTLHQHTFPGTGPLQLAWVSGGSRPLPPPPSCGSATLSLFPSL